MIKYIENDFSVKIILDYKLKDDDISSLKVLFDKDDILRWELVINRIYSINYKLFNLLYSYKNIYKKDINITTHKYRLHRYLNKLGIKNNFVSLVKDLTKDSFMSEVVLIGGSADSTSKIVEIVSNIKISNISLVIVQHVDSSKDNNFDKILQSYTTHNVIYAKDGLKIEHSHIYLAPKDKHLLVEDGYFKLDDSEKVNEAKPSISVSYKSFATYYKNKLLVVQECGYEKDGVDALADLKRFGSCIIIQDEKECSAKSMVVNAISKNKHDYVFDTKNIIEYINFIQAKYNQKEWIKYLLVEIKKRYSYDFTLYKQNLVRRRLDIFMLKHSITSIQQAIEVILYNKSAFKGFFLELSINVTELFRNPHSYSEVAKMLEMRYTKESYIKVWSAGCSSGEEVYSIAMFLASLGYIDRSIIYATDFNSVVIDEAKNGVYPINYIDLAKENIEKMDFDIEIDKYVINNDNYIRIDENIRSKTHFFTHNLAVDGSFNEFDIIICKNVIIYFNDTLLKRVFKLLYDSLKVGGHLILGESETIHHEYKDKFVPCSKECKIYKKVV